MPPRLLSTLPSRPNSGTVRICLARKRESGPKSRFAARLCSSDQNTSPLSSARANGPFRHFKLQWMGLSLVSLPANMKYSCFRAGRQTRGRKPRKSAACKASRCIHRSRVPADRAQRTVHKLVQFMSLCLGNGRVLAAGNRQRRKIGCGCGKVNLLLLRVMRSTGARINQNCTLRTGPCGKAQRSGSRLERDRPKSGWRVRQQLQWVRPRPESAVRLNRRQTAFRLGHDRARATSAAACDSAATAFRLKLAPRRSRTVTSPGSQRTAQPLGQRFQYWRSLGSETMEPGPLTAVCPGKEAGR